MGSSIRSGVALFGYVTDLRGDKGRFEKKMEFFIKLAGWVLDDPVFH